MLGIVGTIPDLQMPIIHGQVRLVENHLEIAGRRIAINRGTPALIGAALKAARCVQASEIYAFLVGDIGTGEGSRKLYDFLTQHLHEFAFKVLTFHYMQPDVDRHNKVLSTIEALPKRPILIADAGFMYVAKMSGHAAAYDFFTPDVGELAYIADELAPHPFYARGFILHPDEKVPDLIQHAYKHKNAAKHLVVKGETDYIVYNGQVVQKVNQPSFEAMEAIGGTGDTITGILSALCSADYELQQAAILASLTNRWVGHYANPTPATQVVELIEKIPQAFEKAVHELEGKTT